MEPWQLLGVSAARLALEDAGIVEAQALEALYLNVCANGGARECDLDIEVLEALHAANDPDAALLGALNRKLRRSFLLGQLSNMLAGNIAIILGVGGGARSFMGGYMAGADALADAVARVRHWRRCRVRRTIGRGDRDRHGHRAWAWGRGELGGDDRQGLGGRIGRTVPDRGFGDTFRRDGRCLLRPVAAPDRTHDRACAHGRGRGVGPSRAVPRHALRRPPCRGHGDLTFRPDVDRFDGETVHFKDEIKQLQVAA